MNYGRFCIIKQGLKWEIHDAAVTAPRLSFIPPNMRFWREINAHRVAQSLHLAFKEGQQSSILPSEKLLLDKDPSTDP